MKESELNWFRPLWKRLGVVIFLSIWLAWEAFFNQDQFWSFMIGVVLAYAVYNFFIKFPKEGPASDDVTPSGPTDDKDRQDP